MRKIMVITTILIIFMLTAPLLKAQTTVESGGSSGNYNGLITQNDGSRPPGCDGGVMIEYMTKCNKDGTECEIISSTWNCPGATVEKSACSVYNPGL